MKPRISVIVPIYKTEAYLEKCILSITNQTYDNLEIILVNDGSPDNCSSICETYAIRDMRIKVVHKENGGLSSARNAGLDIAIGDWIGFVDSDDYVLPNMYEKLYSAIVKESADLAICGYEYVDEYDSIIHEVQSSVKNETLSRFEAFNKLNGHSNVFYVTVVNKLYSKRLFEHICFPERRIHEDEFIIHHIFNKCEKIVTISNCLYKYVQREGSIMTKPFSIKRLDGYYAGLDRFNFFTKLGMNKNAKYAVRFMYEIILNLFKHLDYKSYKSEIKPAYRKTLFLLILQLDLRVMKLFLYRHKCLLKLFNFIKKIFTFSRFLSSYLLAKKPYIFFVATPIHGNIGDHAIVYAEYRFFFKQGKHKHIVEIRNDDWLICADWIEKYVKPSDTIVIDGGGNLGTLWPREDDKISNIISRFRKNEIIIFPQTCWYDNTANAFNRLRRNKKVYANATQLTVMLRDQASYDFALKNFPKTKFVLTRDIAFEIDDAPKNQLKNCCLVLLCLRKDHEKVLPDEDIARVIGFLTKSNVTLVETTTVIDQYITPSTRKQYLMKKWQEFADARLVITDRLHGMIFAYITNTSCIAIDNKSGKVSGNYMWIKENPKIRMAHNADEIIEYASIMIGV